MRRPGPLKDLPLDLFLPQANNVFRATANKRPISPGAVTLSPVKRRILDEDLFFSPEKAARTSPHGSKVLRRALDGPGSPARKLHFGVPKDSREDINLLTPHTPATSSSSCYTTVVDSSKVASSSSARKLAPSPELRPKTRSSHRRALSEVTTDDEIKRKTECGPLVADRNPVTIPRELLPLLDRQSVHHPGFDIYQDKHLYLSYGRLFPSPDQVKDRPKENFPPLKKTRQLEPTTPDADKGASIFPKIPSFPHTPRKKHGPVDDGKRDIPTSPTPRRPTARLNAALHSPLATPVDSKMERRERRRLMLEEELDDGSVDGGDDLTYTLL